MLIAHGNGALSDSGVLTQHRLDLAQLNTEAPDFDLMVVAAQKLNRSTRAPDSHITGAVKPQPGG
jgi:predicted alpha/beta-hydrolase family hydrolase